MNINKTLPPYYHPTTVCFVDDNMTFLRSLSLDLPAHWSVISFVHPEDALRVVNTPASLPPLVERCFTMEHHNPSQPLIHFNLSALEQEITHIERFQRISVIMVDYAMPTMNGLEFCEQIANSQIKRALLTGVADEKTAVAAFNAGLIDRYIPKAQLIELNNVVPHVEELQAAYFDQYSAQVRENLAINPPAFMAVPGVVNYFHEIIRREHIVEYYLTGDPYGYLMLRSNGSMLRMVVLSAAELNSLAKLAQQFNAPQSICESLSTGREIAYLYEHPAHYLGHETFPWTEFMLDAQTIAGQPNWYVGVYENPPVDVDFKPQLSSYQQYLRSERPMA